eukprot:978954-Alexandrium_andersonii.AAC.1
MLFESVQLGLSRCAGRATGKASREPLESLPRASREPLESFPRAASQEPHELSGALWNSLELSRCSWNFPELSGRSPRLSGCSPGLSERSPGALRMLDL